MKTIDICGDIGYPVDTTQDIDQFRENQLKDIVNCTDKEINVKINSFGGDVNHAIAFRNALTSHSAKIFIEYVGWSASAATIIGTAGHVKAAANIMILPHESRGAVRGVTADIKAYGDWLEKTNDIIADMYVEKTGKSKEEMLAVMAKNNGEGEWLTASEAKELGFIDEVFEPMQAAAIVDVSKYDLPEIPENKLNQINMNIFKKKEEELPLNKIQLGEAEAVYQGDLKAGIKLMPLNAAELEDGEYTLGGKTIIIKSSVVEDVQEPEPEAVAEEMEKKDEEIEALKAQVKSLDEKYNADVEALNEKFSVIENKLAETKSTHVVNTKDEVKETKNELPLALQIKKAVREEIQNKKEE